MYAKCTEILAWTRSRENTCPFYDLESICAFPETGTTQLSHPRPANPGNVQDQTQMFATSDQPLVSNTAPGPNTITRAFPSSNGSFTGEKKILNREKCFPGTTVLLGLLNMK